MITSFLAAACERPEPPVGGEELFVKHCASCHGVSGAGDGPLASELRLPPANLRTIAQRRGGFDESFVLSTIDGRRAVASHGPREMPVWGDVFESELSEREVPRPQATAVMRAQLLTDYVRTLQEP
ncbi:MAG TPA: cytochrome c [Myxococcota bacterium]|nr:cytochrome c [Myxococcota bacterium]